MSKKMTTQDIIDILEGKITSDTYPIMSIHII